MTQRRELTPVGDLIDQVLGKLSRPDVAPIVDLRRNWDEVAGEWAARCRPVALAGGVLTVEVGSGMDASRLRYAGSGLLEGVRRHLGGAAEVVRLQIRVGRAS